MDLSRLDIDGASFQRDPYPWYAELRAKAPVFRLPDRDWYLVTTRELVLEVLADPGTFSSRYHRQSKPPAEAAETVARLRAGRPESISVFVGSDPPEHETFRGMANRAFTTRAVASMTAGITRVVGELIAALPATTDFVPSFAALLPAYAMAEILGLDASYRDRIVRWTGALTAALGRELPAEQWVALETERADFDHAILKELALRRESPRGDLLSSICESVDADDPKRAEAVALSMVRQLIAAGNETTTRVLTEAVALLGTHPEQWQLLREDPARAGKVFEEAARLSAPVQQMVRRSTRAVTLGGVRLPADAKLLVSFASASRDEAVFTHPDRFDPDRPELRRHLAFGHGPHACLGIGLARLEGAITLRELSRTMPEIRVLDHEPRFLASYLLRGRLSLPLELTR